MHEPLVFQAHDNYVLGVVFSQKHKHLITSGMDKLIKTWSFPDIHLLDVLQGHQNSVNSISLNPDESLLASASTDAAVGLWSYPQGKLLNFLTDHKKTASHVRFSPTGHFLGSTYYGGYAAIWGSQGESILHLRPSRQNLGTIAFHPSEQYFAVAGLGEDISFWSLPDGQPLHRFSGHPVATSGLYFLQNGGILVTLGYDQTIKFWDTQTWELSHALPFQDQKLRSLAFSEAQQTMAVGMEGAIQLWSLKDLRLINDIRPGVKAINQISFTADGRWLAAGAADQKVRIWALD